MIKMVGYQKWLGNFWITQAGYQKTKKVPGWTKMAVPTVLLHLHLRRCGWEVEVSPKKRCFNANGCFLT